MGDVARTDLEDLILSKAPEYLADLVAADEDLRTGKTRGAPRRLR